MPVHIMYSLLTHSDDGVEPSVMGLHPSITIVAVDLYLGMKSWSMTHLSDPDA